VDETGEYHVKRRKSGSEGQRFHLLFHMQNHIYICLRSVKARRKENNGKTIPKHIVIYYGGGEKQLLEK
jgi:hypothetical protein